MKTFNDFNTLVDQYSQEIIAYLWRVMQNVQDAEDVFQETFIRAFKAYPYIKSNDNLRAWLYKIATNTAYTHIKNRNRHLLKITNLHEFTYLGSNDNFEQRDLVEIVLDAVNKLPNKQKSALMLRNYQGLSYKEIAIVLNCSPESARANVYQALRKLRNQLTGRKG